MAVDLQKQGKETSPFVIKFREIEVRGVRSNVNGFIVGPSFNDNNYAHVTK